MSSAESGCNDEGGGCACPHDGSPSSERIAALISLHQIAVRPPVSLADLPLPLRPCHLSFRIYPGRSVIHHLSTREALSAQGRQRESFMLRHVALCCNALHGARDGPAEVREFDPDRLRALRVEQRDVLALRPVAVGCRRRLGHDDLSAEHLLKSGTVEGDACVVHTTPHRRRKLGVGDLGPVQLFHRHGRRLALAVWHERLRFRAARWRRRRRTFTARRRRRWRRRALCARRRRRRRWRSGGGSRLICRRGGDRGVKTLHYWLRAADAVELGTHLRERPCDM